MGQRLSSGRNDNESHNILTNDIANSSGLRQFYPVLAVALEQGSDIRPGLPIELVSYIMRLADCVLLSMHSRISTANFVVCSVTSQVVSQPCLLTDPVSREMIPHLARMRLTTNSHDQGWYNYPDSGSWTWFEVALVEHDASGNLRVKVRRSIENDSSAGDINTPEIATTLLNDAQPLSWISHRNRQGSVSFIVQEGIEFGPDHEIWQHISEGDQILVRACAKYGSWKNHIDWTALKIWEWYNPVNLG
ncbi:hypothetical protein Clacol_007251 [Clathrus columnatus]|uniref:Uncharacterized protein n=1 Tax=Clathrus columnatus TaxID=1419009 RepID=A0AAV5AH83_9AGAM|nr:hypothetical protein Clacol_007251 [Clathrus columnatus]